MARGDSIVTTFPSVKPRPEQARDPPWLVEAAKKASFDLRGLGMQIRNQRLDLHVVLFAGTGALAWRARPDSRNRVVALDQNLERPKPDIKETAPTRGS